MVYYAKTRAIKEGLPFDLSPEDIIIPAQCPVFPHIRLEIGKGNKTDNSPSLDKIIPELGYVHGNVEVMSMKANRMKSDGTLQELVLLGQWAQQRLSGSFVSTYTDGRFRRPGSKQKGHLATMGNWVYVRFRANTESGRKMMCEPVCPAEGLAGWLPVEKQQEKAIQIVRNFGALGGGTQQDIMPRLVPTKKAKTTKPKITQEQTPSWRASDREARAAKKAWQEYQDGLNAPETE
jgi:hypothetical protein